MSGCTPEPRTGRECGDDLLAACEAAFEELADTFHGLTAREQRERGPVHAMVMGQLSAAIAQAKRPAHAPHEQQTEPSPTHEPSSSVPAAGRRK